MRLEHFQEELNTAKKYRESTQKNLDDTAASYDEVLHDLARAVEVAERGELFAKAALEREKEMIKISETVRIEIAKSCEYYRGLTVSSNVTDEEILKDVEKTCVNNIRHGAESKVVAEAILGRLVEDRVLQTLATEKDNNIFKTMMDMYLMKKEDKDES